MPALTEKGLVTIGVSKGLILPLRCPNCGIFTPGAEARAMIRAGQKVRCQCNDNLTAIAWAAMEGR